MIKVIVAGGKVFEDYSLLEEELDTLREKFYEDFIIVSGRAKGADTRGEAYAAAHDLDITVFHADWNTHGNAAGPIRNREMAKYADMLVAFWDGNSRGTKNMIDTALKLGLLVKVIRYD